MPDPWRIELLDKRRHDRKPFTCGKPDLDNYLKKIARRASDLDTGRTFVLIPNDDKSERIPIIGYYALASCHVGLQALPQDRRAGLPSEVPATLIGRLAVDSTRQGQGLGGYLLIDALRRIEVASREVASYAAVVDAIDAAAESFYVKYGFLKLCDGPRRLFLPMSTIRQLARRT